MHESDPFAPPEPPSLAEYLPEGIRCIGVVSGKGGVGKSVVTGLLAVALARSGHPVGILDADLTGPSIPRMLGVVHPGEMAGSRMLPALSPELGIRVMSINLLLQHDDDPVIWRGPLLAKTIEQFVTDVAWEGCRYLLLDLPPGTSDVPLTVMQRLPLSGLLVVTAPQELVGMIVAEAVKMARLMKVPVLGLVENMTHLVCPVRGGDPSRPAAAGGPAPLPAASTSTATSCAATSGPCWCGSSSPCCCSPSPTATLACAPRDALLVKVYAAAVGLVVGLALLALGL